MNTSLSLPFFTNLLILLIAARLLGEIFERVKQPAMIGEIIAGIILGPTLLGVISLTEDIRVIAELGVFLLVIMAGLEVNADDIVKSLRGKNIFITIMAFFVPLLCGFAVGYLFKMSVTASIFIGLCISITALPISVRILMDLKIINTDIGQKILSAAIFEDVMALMVLGIILNAQNSDRALLSIVKETGFSLLKLGIFFAILFVSYKITKKISKKPNYLENILNSLLDFLKGKESLFALFFCFVLLFAAITETLGFHFIIGAFFASLLINKNLIGDEHHATIQKSANGLAMGFLAPIFFASIGLEFNFAAIHNYGLLITVLLVSYLSKIAGGYLGGRLAKLEKRASFSIGIGLNARGIMELVIANIAYKSGLINLEIFSILVLMGVLTTLTTPSMLKWSLKKQKL
ncbi:MAG: cation:proton antiporter [Prevotellaceae bacterium]|jgi:Kef-type K+ transport system membrane component KefB|nr:cation:proton antiporter [Prevotellaceae bacterium]